MPIHCRVVCIQFTLYDDFFQLAERLLRSGKNRRKGFATTLCQSCVRFKQRENLSDGVKTERSNGKESRNISNTRTFVARNPLRGILEGTV